MKQLGDVTGGFDEPRFDDKTDVTSISTLAESAYDNISLGDLTAIRNLLRGGSVIDWHRAYFSDRQEVDRFLRVQEMDPENLDDMAHLENLRGQAVDYLERHLQFQIPEEVAELVPAPDLLLLASHNGKRRTHACMVLKVMHVLQHLAGRELFTRLPVSSEQLFHLVEEKALRTVEALTNSGLGLVQFEWSRKRPDSLITKLMAKKNSIAANVYDKLRFRVITKTKEELVFVLQELVHRLIPFNYVVPGQSVNSLVNLKKVMSDKPTLQRFLPDLMRLSRQTPDKPVIEANEFSGPSYRVLNFVADLPVRIDKFLCRPASDPLFAENGAVVYVLSEFQIVDAETAEANELGQNSHAQYKERQINQVKARLMHGVQDD